MTELFYWHKFTVKSVALAQIWVTLLNSPTLKAAGRVQELGYMFISYIIQVEL